MFKIKNLLKLFIFLFLILVASVSQGKVSDRLKGYAWSDGAGWISFNCSNTNSCDVVDYGVTTDSSGNLSGYAWSDHLGWLSFNSGDMVGLSGASDPKINLSTGVLSGNAYFIAGSNPDDDGWLGLIDLTASPYTSNGVVLDNTISFEFSGWSWGDVNAGWISFNCSDTSSCSTSNYRVTYDPFYFDLTASKGLNDSDKVSYGGSTVLSWVTIGASGNCTATEGNSEWTGGNPYSSGGGSSVQKTISGLTADTLFKLTCSDSAGNFITRELNILVKPPAPVVTIGADDTNIAYNSSTNINWATQNVVSCTASGAWSGSKASGDGSHSESSGPLTDSANVFNISCDSNNPSEYPDPVSASVTVNVEKLIVELRPDLNPVPYNEKIKLYYQTEFPTSGTCVATGDVPDWAGSSIDENPGEHSFITTDPITDGASYTATLTCDGTGGQQESATININARKKPIYQEI